ncbi:MAG: phosphotransferase [Acidimicrobiia bacterium]|nr:phosphotransferase [Acidimicrobiia bacterium]
MSSAAPPEVPAGIDAGRVQAWFAEHLPPARPPLRFDRVVGGHSCLTFVVTDAEEHRFVLRRPPLGHVLESAHDVLREHRIIAALGPTPVPVPEALAACGDVEVNGAPFYVMSYVPGVAVHNAEDAAAALPSVEARRHAAETLVDALVALHAVEPDEVGLGTLARQSGYLDRQLKRWHGQYEASRTRDLPAMGRLHTWLVANKPPDVPARIAHGDFRLGNVLHAPDGEVRAVLDWELCTLGDPLSDVSYLLRFWVEPGEPLRSRTEPPTYIGGFPTKVEVAARYAERSGRDVGALDYWMAFHAWRSAAIGQGVYRRYIDGNMGDVPEDVEDDASNVEASAEAGLLAAGLS